MAKNKKEVDDVQGTDSTVEKKRSGSVSYSIKALRDHLDVLLCANVISLEEFNIINNIRTNAGGEWLKKQIGL